MALDFLHAPIDRASADALAAQRLRLGLVDAADPEAFAAWSLAEHRGFHSDAPSQERVQIEQTNWTGSRMTGVWDGSEPSPVATVGSWPAQLTVPAASAPPEGAAPHPAAPGPSVASARPGSAAPRSAASGHSAASARPRTITSWLISAVTVAPTHRRRGIARALIEAELRTAHALGVPLAALTASEATIYGRYGFGPAAFVADYTIDTRRARWVGGETPGCVRFVEQDELERDGKAAYDAQRLATPGAIELDRGLWRKLVGLDAEPDRARQLRAVRYDDADGTLRGFAVYRTADDGRDFTRHTVHVHQLVAATDDAASALWRFLIELDLVATVKAPWRSVDEPFRWQLDDLRAVRTDPSETDFLWLRVLDARAALQARGYAAAGTLALDVADPLGFVPPHILLRTDAAGTGTVTLPDTDAPVPDGAAHLALDVRDLATLYLGGVSARTLVRAGRVAELRPGSAEAADGMLRSPVAPWLGVMF